MNHSLRGCLLTAFLSVLLPGLVLASVCGDDVDGRDVPCGCGDTVVSSLRLGASDPVTAGECQGHGLVVRPSAKAVVVLDLAGRELRGSGRGTGIVLDVPSGAVVRVRGGGEARLLGFRDGVSLRAAGSISVGGLTIEDARRDGVRAEGAGYSIQDVSVAGAGRHGFVLDGRDYALRNLRVSKAGRSGFDLAGSGARVQKVLADESGDSGIRIRGRSLQIEKCRSVSSRNDGIVLSGRGHWLTGCIASRNGRDGLVGTGSEMTLQRNLADRNGRHGIRVRGANLVDGGANSGRNSGASRTVACEIGGMECAR